MARARAVLIAAAIGVAAIGGCTCRRASGPAEASGPSATRDSAAVRPPGPAAATVLRTSAQCGGTSSGAAVRWLGTEDEFRAALDALDRGRLPGTAPATKAVDFDTHGVLLVEMGRRATAGYALELATDEVRTSGDGTGIVRVNWTEPPEDSMVAQVVTSPCLVVAVRKQGLRALEVVDQTGAARQRVEVH